jgi:hypothetical protein
MNASSVPSRELLAAASRQRREVDLDDVDELPARVAPGKQSVEQRADLPAPPTTPGKQSRWDAGRVDLTPAEALDYSALVLERGPRGPRGPQIDRRAEQDGDVDEGALAAAFTFIEESRAGQPLPEELRRRLAAELGADLAQVRVHTDDRAARAAAALRARAFTIGDDVYFAAGAYDPVSEGGVELIAHEVTHVVQQRGSHASGPPRRVSHAGDRQEQEADEFSRRFAGRHGRPGADRAELAGAAARMRAEAARAIPAPFLDELERHFGTAFGDAQARTGEAARLAVQLMAAGASAVRSAVALASPSPRRAQLLDDLSHVVQLGKAAAPAWAAVVRAPVTPAAEPGVIHRDPDPTPTTPTESTDVARAASPDGDQHQWCAGPPCPGAPRIAVPREDRPLDVRPVHRRLLADSSRSETTLGPAAWVVRRVNPHGTRWRARGPT